MWLLFLFLTGTEIFVLAEKLDEDIKDGELSRKILGQSVVTSVSVVMDIGNGTKTIFTDPLGKPMERPSSSSDLASPINLLNPDRYEFYTFDDNGNLVRRLMSLEEIKGIIATGDSDGLEYDSVLSESYIPEKRVNDVLSNVQNVLKEEMEIHSTKLDAFPALDTPDVSDSWNMILPAVFGNSGADITPDKAPLHVTPDTIMIEPTEKSHSTPRSTPIQSSSTKDQSQSERIPSSTYPTIFSRLPDHSSTMNSIIWDLHPALDTESKEDGVTLNQATDLTTKEYIPLSTLSPHTERIRGTETATTNTEAETTVKSTTEYKTEYIKIEPILTSTEITRKNTTELVTSSNQTSYTTVTVPSLRINSTSELSTITETQTTNLPELTIQSVESSINCTSVKNESDGGTTTVVPMFDESLDKIAAPEIINQLLSTAFVNANTDITDTVSQMLNNFEIVNETDNITTQIINNINDRFETTPYFTETVASENFQKNKNSTASVASNTFNTDEYSTTETLLPDIYNKNNITNYLKESEDTSVLPTTASTLESTIIPIFIKNISVSTEKVLLETLTKMPASTSTERILSQNQTKTPQIISTETSILDNQTKTLSNEMPVKSTKIENTNETIEEQIVKSTPGSLNQDSLNATTILVPLTIIDSSTITANDLIYTTIRVPLIDPSESKTNTIRPSVGTFINEKSTESNKNSTTASVTSTEVYDKIKIIDGNVKENANNSTNNNTTESSLILTTEKISLTTEKFEIKTTVTEDVSKETESVKKEPNWTLVPTIAPHSGGNFGTVPPTSESYPDVLEPSEPIYLKAEPLSGFGLEESTALLDKDIYQFSQLYNELAFEFWKTTTSSLSHARSLVVSPFGTISLLAMIFLGARGSTSAEMNEILKLDDMITFNPHLVLKNVGESLAYEEKDSGVVTLSFIKELFMCRMKGKFLPFYKERVKAFYDGFAEEVNYAEIGDIVRRRTNLQVKKQTDGRIPEFLTDTSVFGRPPLVGLGVNIFQTDCSGSFYDGRDGEMHFTVLPSIRQRRLVPIPAVLYKHGFLAGYEPSLDATAVSIGGKNQTISTVFVMPGQQGTPAPGDGLARLEKSLVESSFKKGAWSRLLRSLIPRAELEVQIPKIVHRSVINSTDTLKKMGFIELFKKGQADLVGMNGISNDLYLSDMIQINQFTTCAERRTEHHSEIYPNANGRSQRNLEDHHLFRNFEDPLHDLSYLDLPLPLRPRQARKPDTPRLRFDRPFLYFVRHNPTGLILHIGRFNPRLLP